MSDAPATQPQPAAELVLVQKIKAPNDSNGAQRVLWLVLGVPAGRKRARVRDVIMAIELPAKYADAPRLPTIMTHAAGYGAWESYREQQLDESGADE